MKKTKKNLKMFLTILLLVGVLFALPQNIIASSGIKVFLEDTELNFDVSPQIINGRTLLPLRVVFENLGLEVGWDAETKTITGIKDSTEIILKLDSVDATVNGINKKLDVPAKAINGRTLVPLRFIAESLDMNVTWNQGNTTIKISKEDIVEWKYEGYEATSLKEYEKKYVNGMKTDETRYNGKVHVIKEVKKEWKMSDLKDATKESVIGKWKQVGTYEDGMFKESNTETSRVEYTFLSDGTMYLTFNMYNLGRTTSISKYDIVNGKIISVSNNGISYSEDIKISVDGTKLFIFPGFGANIVYERF